MDLLDFEGQNLYFDEPLPPEINDLIREAGDLYGEGLAERPLLEALARAPGSLTVLVALYRFYYYQHRLSDAIDIAGRAMDISARELGIPMNWRKLEEDDIARAALVSMGLLRFHLLALKAAAYLKLRLQDEEGKSMLRKLTELDTSNRLGARQLLDVVETRLRVVA